MGKPVPPFVTPLIGADGKVLADVWQKYFVNLYREDEWVPYLLGSTSTAGQTYALQAGRLVKVGRLVTLTGLVQVTVPGTITGHVTIGPLPFPAEPQASGAPPWVGPVFFAALATPWASIVGAVNPVRNPTDPDWDRIALQGVPAGGAGSMQPLGPSDVGPESLFAVTVSYLAQE